MRDMSSTYEMPLFLHGGRFSFEPPAPPAPPEPPVTEDTESSLLEDVGSVFGDVGEGILEAPEAVVRGVSKGVTNIFTAADDLADWLNENVANLEVPIPLTGIPAVDEFLANPAAAIAGPPGVADELTDEPTSVTGSLVQGISQFLSGYQAKGLKAGAQALTSGIKSKAVRNIADPAIRGAGADPLVFDPHEARLSDLLREHLELNDPITAYLASSPEDTAAEGRLKNALEGLVIGVGADVFIRGLIWAVRVSKARINSGAKSIFSTAVQRYREGKSPIPMGMSIEDVGGPGRLPIPAGRVDEVIPPGEFTKYEVIVEGTGSDGRPVMGSKTVSASSPEEAIAKVEAEGNFTTEGSATDRGRSEIVEFNVKGISDKNPVGFVHAQPISSQRAKSPEVVAQDIEIQKHRERLDAQELKNEVQGSGGDIQKAAAVVPSTITSPKTLRNRGRQLGIPEEDLPRFVEETKRIQLIRKSRQVARAGGDPLERAKSAREYKAKVAKRIREATDSPMAKSWNKAFREKVERAGRIQHNVEGEAQLATIEAIVRAARKRGWKVGHTSRGKARASSRYIEVPGRGQVRVSDHYLPETPQREHMQSMGMSGRWVDEIVVDDWRTTSLDDYMRRLEGTEELNEGGL